jgi:hypothetical protein
MTEATEILAMGTDNSLNTGPEMGQASEDVMLAHSK